METLFGLIYLLETLIVLLVMYCGRELILSRIYGHRFKHYTEIDTGTHGYCILSKNLDTAKIGGTSRAISYQNIEHGMIYIYNNLAENVHTEYANTKALFYQNSNEYDTLLNNNVYQKLLITKAESMITIMLVLIVIVLITSIYIAYNLNQLKPVLEAIYNIVNSSGVNSSGVKIV